MTAITTPLRFRRICLPKVWGGRALESALGIELPPGKIGETWEVVDRDDQNSVVSSGEFEGAKLRELMQRGARDILGRSSATRDGHFPLLVKYLDASQNLSVQVHPDDLTAARLGGGAEGKTEAWYFLGAPSGGRVLAGLLPSVDAARFEAEAATAAVERMLGACDVVPGQCLTVPGGTVHAICAGVTLLEVQQNSDTTYRLYDWGREGRETHVAQAKACVHFGAPPPAPVAPVWRDEVAGLRRADLGGTDYFKITALCFEAGAELATGGRAHVYSATAGSGRLLLPGREAGFELATGDTLLIPAATPEHRVEPGASGLTLVRMEATA